MPSKIKRVNAYQTSDGKLIANRDEYLAHERELEFGAGIAQFVESRLKEFWENDHGTPCLGVDDLKRVLLEGSAELLTILSGKRKRAPRVKKSSESLPAKSQSFNRVTKSVVT